MLSQGLIVRHEDMGDYDQKLRRLVLKGPFAKIAKAGQFVSLQVQDSARASLDPLLRRPISIAEICQEREEITLLYRIKGRGTKILAQARCGESLSILGPLGNGFSLPQEGELWLVAGGIGIFPLFALAQKAIAQGLNLRLFWGGENKAFLESAGLTQWRELAIEMSLSTLDGSLGSQGLVTEPVREALNKLEPGNKNGEAQENRVHIAVCGPKGMMQSVAELCKTFKIPAEVSLEERMGCAVGACLGCVCALKDSEGRLIHKKVCLDGPVFPGEEVVWDETC
ncbi:2-polyprenylphenol hydroxylase-like oxidoreductase [Desulfosporosinus acidiphilus SJ4]|uniref:2-polyprenylphenol hydroxylase-like oxidoreductase n=1 Tax=Desulfosporosinus acidiphilus (strain DSM 22704 / JCM 16185 / SJ4) TaxID=646529 RepID=I4D9X2_DESAJ|nr:dihydroorotate dehydrogenase electron transfer subunit [Desulfosporosinus acidiphilus]AFM42596.1 2-polyprenylphenol hydroxylase-like oxidoreductase [Desulfosporosinus acidiphilus SJ4]